MDQRHGASWRVLADHNPRVVVTSDQIVLGRELASTGKDGGGDALASQGQAAVIVERLSEQQSRALIESAERTDGVAARKAALRDGSGSVLCGGSVAALGALTRGLVSARSAQFAVVGRVIDHALRCYRRTDFRLPLPGGRKLTVGRKAGIMGVLNVTPDSFFDGGSYVTEKAAVHRGLQLLGEGADIIDVGGESTRPGALSVRAAEQLRRIGPVVEALADEGAVVSVDTSVAQVARQALDLGAAMVNDVTALRGDPEMASLLASRKDVPVVLMHMKGTPRTMQESPAYDNLMSEVSRFLRERVAFAAAAGIDESRIIVDPGVGFGKTVEHNLELLRRLSEFRSLGRPILVGASRKSFIGNILDLPASERLFGSVAVAALCASAGASVLRVHDVRETLHAVWIAGAVRDMQT